MTVLLRGTVSPAACGTISNTAVVISATPDPDPNNNTATMDTTVVPNGTDLTIEKCACPDPVGRGQQVTFTLTVSNAGPAEAEQVTITDILPRELCRAVYSVDNGQSWRCWTGSYTLRTLAAGASFSILIAATVNACARGCICNTAGVSSLTVDPDPLNNTASTTIRIENGTCC